MLSDSGDKEYYDTIKTVVVFNCNIEPKVSIIMPNYYRDEVFVAKTTFPDVFIKLTPEKIKIVNDALCPNLPKE